MPRYDVTLLEWPDDPDSGGPRLLGRLSDSDLVREVRDRIATSRRRELARLDNPVRPAPAVVRKTRRFKPAGAPETAGS